MQSLLISEGIDAVIKYCNDYRSKETLVKYVSACNRIQDVYRSLKQDAYNVQINSDIRNNLHLHSCNGTTLCFNEDRYIYRMLGMLDDYYSCHPFRDKYPVLSRYKHLLSANYQSLAEEFKNSLTITKNSIPVMYSIARDFFYCLQTKELSDFNIIHKEELYAFLMYEYDDHKGCMNNVMYVLRLLCAFFRNKGFTNFPTELLPFSLPPSRKKVLPAFNRADMESVLASPDITSVSGKRDYAILTLASVTGMRAIDIANLKLTDIDWKGMSLHFIQHKTGIGLSLPLDSVAAHAVYDYILNGRPKTDSPHVFLTESAPYRKLSDKSSMANVLNKYVKITGIKKEAHDGKSFHAFRRSIGIWLLNTASEPELISQILGHHSHDVLKYYLSLDESKLGICALGFDGISVRSEVYR